MTLCIEGVAREERENKMRYLLILMGLLVANVASAMDCEKVPTCESLGYASEDDPSCTPDGYVYCPFDENYKKCVNYDCAKMGFTEDDKTSWCGKLIKCRGNPRMTLCQNLCEVGDVYYADGTCGYANEYDPSNKNKTPVGVVFLTTSGGVHGKVMALSTLTVDDNSDFDSQNPFHNTQEFLSVGFSNYIVQGLTPYTSETLAQALQNGEPEVFDGKGNTQKMLAADLTECHNQNINNQKACTPVAAKACTAFYPLGVSADNPKVGAGQWYFPSIGELMQMWGYDLSKVTGFYYSETTHLYQQLNDSLEKLHAKDVDVKLMNMNNNKFWSSTIGYVEGTGYVSVYLINFVLHYHYGGFQDSYVRPVLAF